MTTQNSIITERPPLAAKRARRWLIAYSLLLVLLTHWPNPWPEEGEPNSIDKVVHFALYAGLAVLVGRAVGVRRESGPTLLQLAVVFVVVSAFGLFDEWTQPYMRRDFEWLDWLADVLGAATGIGVYYFVRQRWRARA